ncbi:MAG TPA: aminoglycoside phosphotransferase family protein [Herpetosiphonaceae bacterium]
MSFTRPIPVPVSAQVLQTIAARLGVPHARCEPLAAAGAANAIYAIGESYLLRVPHQHPMQASAVQREVAAVASARTAGVQTPAIVLVDEACDLLPVPYAVYERLDAIPLSALAPPLTPPPTTWYALGQDLARLHTQVTAETNAGRQAAPLGNPDPRPWLDELAQRHQAAEGDVAWLESWLRRLWPLTLAARTTVFCHGDVNAGNILVDRATFAYRALIDWGGSGWHDPAWDFVPVTLAAVPGMLEGYRSLIELPNDAQAEGRILAYHLQLALWGLRFQPPEPRLANERLARLQAGVAMFVEHPRARWLADL